LIYGSSSKLNVVVPYEIAGETSAVISLNYGGVVSAAWAVPVAASAPGIFTIAGDGVGAGAVLNQDNSVNSASNPAAIGSVIQIYATGEGQTSRPQDRATDSPLEELPRPLHAYADSNFSTRNLIGTRAGRAQPGPYFRARPTDSIAGRRPNRRLVAPSDRRPPVPSPRIAPASLLDNCLASRWNALFAKSNAALILDWSQPMQIRVSVL